MKTWWCSGLFSSCWWWLLSSLLCVNYFFITEVKGASDWCSGLNKYPSNFSIPLTKLGDGISVGGIILCNSTEAANQTLTLTIVGPINRWFGLAFGTSMLNDAVIYTTGKKGTDSLRLYDYKNTARSSSGVTKDSAQDWMLVSSTTDSSQVTLVYYRLLDTGDKQDRVFTGNDKTLDVMYAIGKSGRYDVSSEHAITSEEYYTLDFISGGVGDTVSSASQIKKWHGGIMWFAWNMFAYPGIIAARYKTDIICLIGKVYQTDRWFFTHIWCMRTAAILVIIGFGLGVAAVDEHFNKIHTIVGLVIFILVVLQVFNAVIRPHKVENVTSQPWPRYIWEMIHKNSGRSIVILSIFNVFAGLLLLDVPDIIIILQFIFIVILALSVFSFEMYLRFWRKGEKLEEKKEEVEM